MRSTGPGTHSSRPRFCGFRFYPDLPALRTPFTSCWCFGPYRVSDSAPSGLSVPSCSANSSSHSIGSGARYGAQRCCTRLRRRGTAAGPVAAWIGPDYGWRVVFWMGALPALLVLFIRRADDDSEIYNESRRTRVKAPGVAAIFARSRLKVTAAAALLAVGAQGAGFAVSNYLTTFLVHERGLSPSRAGVYVPAQQPWRILWLYHQRLDW